MRGSPAVFSAVPVCWYRRVTYSCVAECCFGIGVLTLQLRHKGLETFTDNFVVPGKLPGGVWCEWSRHDLGYLGRLLVNVVAY